MYISPHLVTAKYGDVPTELYSNPQLKEFTESPDYVARRVKGDDFYSNYTAQDLNIELDKNRTSFTIKLTKLSRFSAKENY